MNDCQDASTWFLPCFLLLDWTVKWKSTHTHESCKHMYFFWGLKSIQTIIKSRASSIIKVKTLRYYVIESLIIKKKRSKLSKKPSFRWWHTLCSSNIYWQRRSFYYPQHPAVAKVSSLNMATTAQRWSTSCSFFCAEISKTLASFLLFYFPQRPKWKLS